jgi:hypothetical protein
MKKFLIAVLGFTVLASISIKAYSPTGYDEYASITFKEEGKLLIDLTLLKLRKPMKN